MKAKDQQYLLKEKLGEDSKTRTFLAIDLRVKRPVTFIQLKTNLEDNAARHFLLQARSLGQLQHPGLLPLYDMGIVNDRFFYTHRMPPGKPLSEAMGSAGGGQGRSQQFTQTLIRLSDTLDYLHRNRVTLQRFTAKDISIGSFGEVVFHNFSLAIHHRSSSDEGSFSEGKQTDLKNLAEVGLRLWTGSRKTEEISIRNWDAQAQKLPIELQVIFDRAFLERGGRYPDPSHFSRDLLNFQEGLPPENLKDDLLFRMKGIIFKRKLETLALVATLFICFFLIVIQNHPIGQIGKEIESLNQKRDQTEQMLLAVEDRMSELDASFEARNSELKNYEEKLKEQKEQSQIMKDLRDQAELKRKSLEKEISDLEIKKENLLNEELEWHKKKESWETRIKKQSESILQRGQQLSKVGDLQTRPFSIIELRDEPEELQEYVSALKVNPGWLRDYLETLGESSPNETTQIPLKGPLTHITQEPNSSRLLLLHDKVTIINTTSLLTQKFELPQVGLKNAHFSPRADSFYGSNGQSIITFSSESTLRTIPIAIDGNGLTLLPHGSPRQIHAWNQTNFFSGGLMREPGVPPAYSPASVSLSEGTLAIFSSNDGRFWRLHREGVDLMPLQSRVLTFDSPPKLWFSQMEGGLAVLRGSEIALYPWPEHFEPMTAIARYEVPEKFGSSQELVGDLSEQQLWLRNGNDFLFLSPDSPEPLTLSGLGERLLWWESPNLFCIDNQTLRIDKINKERMKTANAPPAISNQHLKEWHDNAPPGLDFSGGWAFPEEPLVLVLNGKRSIEVWSQDTWSKVGHLALSKEDLKGISFRESDKAIFGLSTKGNWLKF